MNVINRIFAAFPFLRKKIPQEPYVYVAMGDSTVEGIGASHMSKTYPAVIHSALKKSYPNVVFHNLGKSGAKTSDTLETQLEKAIEGDPQLITISVGANDIFKRKSIKSFSINLEHLIKELTEKTNATIVINTIPDFSVVPSIPPVIKTYCEIQGKRFNAVIEKVAEKYNLVLADLYTHTRVLGKQYPELFSDDGLHPSDIGYAIWAHSILVKIEAILKKQTGKAPNTESIIAPTINSK